jgi:integrase
VRYLLASPKKFKVVKHHDAIPYQEVGRFIADLRATGTPPRAAPFKARDCVICSGPHAEEIIEARFKGAAPENLACRFGIPLDSMVLHIRRHVGKPFTRSLAGWALEFTVLTAVRVEQATSARWDEIDLEKRLWTCSQHKTKKTSGKPYSVLLNPQAMAVLKEMKEWQAASGIESPYVFVSQPPFTSSLQAEAPAKLLRRNMGRWDFGKNFTMHGFRAAFRSWGREAGYDEVALEMCLGHEVGNKVSQAYTYQAEMLQARRLIMDAWGNYCDRTETLPATVIPITRAKQQQQELA